MSAYPPIRHFRDAAEDLAHDFMKRQFRDTITDNDAAEYVCADVAAGWIARETGLQSPVGVLHDLVDHMTDGQAATLLAALVQQDAAPALADLQRVLHEQVAHSLSYEAEKIAEGPLPGSTRQDYLEAEAEARMEERWLERRSAGAQ